MVVAYVRPLQIILKKRRERKKREKFTKERNKIGLSGKCYLESKLNLETRPRGGTGGGRSREELVEDRAVGGSSYRREDNMRKGFQFS